MSHHAHRSAAEVRATMALLTVSDSRTAENDRSGALMRRRLEDAGHRILEQRILPDDPGPVRELVNQWLAREDCDGLLVSGGTGISRRDRTFEALSGLLDKQLDGFGELFRMLSFEQVGAAAMLSRATAGIAGNKPVFSLPGSSKAVELALDRLILPELGHLLCELEKG